MTLKNKTPALALAGVLLTAIWLSGCATQYGYDVGDRGSFIVKMTNGQSSYYPIRFNYYVDRFPDHPDFVRLSNPALQSLLRERIPLQVDGAPVRLPMGDFVFAFQCGAGERFARRALTKESLKEPIMLSCP